MTDFFGNVQNVELSQSLYPLVESQPTVEREESPVVEKENNNSSSIAHAIPRLASRQNDHGGTISVNFAGPSALFGVMVTLVISYLVGLAMSA